jgi:hypothetical protein
MPGDFTYAYENKSPLINAWTAHYIAKGCTESKARMVAQKRCERKRTWPQ